ncbi:MAG TPA: autotransporter domain-containing protein [Pseudolabrys sp.]|nr:autotransporter domain-containing protein [Pseudolabrys sp.]
MLLASNAAWGQSQVNQIFQSQGPSPSQGPLETVQSGENYPNGTVTGAVGPIVSDPANNTIYVGTPNGGVFVSRNNGSSWSALSDNQASLSISSLSLDPTDSSHQTLIAGTGLTANGSIGPDQNFIGTGGLRDGLLYTTNGGASWTRLGAATFANQTVADVVSRGATIVAGTYEMSGYPSLIQKTVGGLYRSTDGGSTFTLESGLAGTGLPAGPVTSIVGDPANSSRLYAAVTAPDQTNAGRTSTAIYVSTDTGGTWTQVFGSAQGAGTINTSTQTAIRLAAGPNGSLAAGVINLSTSRVIGLFWSGNSGASWAALPTPSLNPGNQASPNFAIAIDPNNKNIVYVSGDAYQTSPFAVTAFRIDAGTNTTTPITDENGVANGVAQFTANGSTVHADSRSLAFDGSGNLLLSSDGGIYLRTQPQSNAGAWQQLNNTGLAVFEDYGIAYDANSKRLIAAAQDNGVTIQSAPGSAVYNAVYGADGINVAVNDKTLAAQGLSAVYVTDQLLNVSRIILNSSGQIVSPNTTGTYGYGAYVNFDRTVVGQWFSSPLVLNKVDPTRIAVAGSAVYVTQDTLTGANDPSADTVNLSLTRLGTTGAGAQVTKLAYGTVDNPDVLVAGSTSGLWLSTTAAANSLVNLPAYAGAATTGIVFDARSQNRFFVADNSDLYGTQDQGATIQSLTANLPAHFIRPTSLEFISNNGVNALLVGGLNNQVNAQSPIAIADSDSSGNLSNWRLFGSGLPNVPIGALSYNPAADVLAVGSFGRGNWILYDVTSYFAQASVLQFGLADNDSTPDASYLSDGTVGSRPLIKYGAGTLTIGGTASYTGATTVNDGRLIITGDISSSSGLTALGGTVFGTGVLPATTVNAGATLSPGLPGTPGTLTVRGNLVLASGSTYAVQAAPGTIGNTLVTGTATLNGNATVSFGSGVYHAGTYAVVTATSGRSGTFSSLTTQGTTTGVGNPHLTYDGFDAFLVLDPRVALVGGESGNQTALGNAINNALNAGATIPSGFQTLLNLSGPALDGALDQVSGQSNGGIVQAGSQLTTSFLSMLLNPFAGAPDGNSGALGYARAFAADTPSPQAAAAYAAVTPKDRRHDSFERRWSVWTQGYGGYNRTGGDNAAGTAETTVRAFGLVTGFDYRAASDLLVGFALGGGGTNWSLSQGLGGGRSDALQIGLYARKQFGAAYVAGALSYAWHNVTTDRNVTVSGTDQLEAKFRAQNFAGRIEAGYRFDMPVIAVTPYGAFQAQATRTPAYSETAVSGSSVFALSYAAQTSTATRVELGTWLDRTIALANGDAIAWRGRVAWAHDHAGGQVVSAAFQTLPGSNFTVNGAAPPSDLALFTTGAEYRLANGFSFGAKLDAELASGSRTYAGTVNVRYSW